jgi:hypothetical protein
VLNESEKIIDSLLSDWHKWSSMDTGARELWYQGQAAGLKMWRASRQYDDQNGALDADAHLSLMQAVDNVIEHLPRPEYTIVHVHAKNLAIGATVWRSPRLPQNRDELQALLNSARGLVSRQLAELGVL